MKKIEVTLIFVIFFMITTVMTYPFILKITTHIPGFFSTDEPFGILWASWQSKYSITNKLPLKHTTLVAYPFGIVPYTFGSFYNIWTILFISLSCLTTPVLTYNLQVLLNIVLCALFTYFLVLRLTDKKSSAIFSGIIFAFCPYQMMRSWQHFGLTFNEWIPLCLLTAIAMKENPTKKNFILFSLSILLLFSFDFVVMYIVSITLAAFILFSLFYNWKIKFFKEKSLFFQDLAYIKRIFLAGIIVFVILSPQFLFIIKNSIALSRSSVAAAHNYYHRPFEDLFIQSARPLSYILPAAVHPVFGKFAESLVGTSWYGTSFTEHTLYLGWVGIMLAFIAFRQWRKARRQGVSTAYISKKNDFYVGFFLFLVFTAWFFSQPPWWKLGSLKVFMPSYFMYKILPMFRAYCRFGIVVMLAVAVLAGYGLRFILEKFKSQKVKIAMTCLLSGLVLFEFWNWPPYKVIDVSGVPQVYYWLRDEPGDFVIAEYPQDAIYTSEKYRFYQTKHHKKIVNGTLLGTYANKVARTLMKLSDLRTVQVLKWMEVKYVLVHRDDYAKTELIEDRKELDKVPHNPGLKYIRSFPAQECPQKDIMCVQKTGVIDVYEVIAEPIEPQVKE